MEISDIKRRVVETIERARRQAAGRRTRNDEVAREYETFLNQTAIPVFKQVSNVLRAEGFTFTVFTPGGTAGSVRLMSDRSAEDYIELSLDTSGEEPMVSGRTGRSRGRRVIESEDAIGPPATLTENDVLSFVLKALEPLVER
jgi:hypothetical protein